MQLKIFCDGGARGNPGPAAAAFVVADEFGEIVYKSGEYLGSATNNQAEYSAVSMALSWLAQNQPGAEAEIFLDSQLVVNQLNGNFKVKNPDLKTKYQEIKFVMEKIKLSHRAGSGSAGKIKNFVYIPRAKNFLADSLVNQTINQYISD